MGKDLSNYDNFGKITEMSGILNITPFNDDATMNKCKFIFPHPERISSSEAQITFCLLRREVLSLT